MVLGSNDAEVKETMSQLSLLSGELSQQHYRTNGSEWKALQESVNSIANHIAGGEYRVDLYKLNLLRNAVIPYIRKLKSRLILNKARFSQIQTLLNLLSCDVNNGHSIGDDHPAVTLLMIDDIVASIVREGGWWKSEFASQLQVAVDYEWRPILDDNRRALQSIGSKLAAVGLIEIVRPVLLVWPIWMIVTEVLTIVRSVNEKRGLHPDSIIQLCKSAVLLVVVYILIMLVGMMPGLGYSSMLLGAACLMVSSTPALLKHACPYIAPNLAQFQFAIHQLEKFETGTLGAFRTASTSSERLRQEQGLCDIRVEEISEENKESPHRDSDEPSVHHRSDGDQIDTTLGIRKRK